MRCLRCGTEGASGDYCPRCGRRLFAWLGDPLGAMEVTGTIATAAATPRFRPATSTAKVIVGLCAVMLAFVASPVWAAGLLIGFLVVLWRWPGIGWMPWSIFLGGGLLLAVLFQSGVSQSTVGSAPKPVSTPVATAVPGVGQAYAAYDRGAELWREGNPLAAIERLTQAIDLRPQWSDPYNLRALARVSAGQLDPALDDAQRALDLDSSASKIDTLDTRAYVLLKRGAYESALADYDAVMAAPGEPPAASRLGRGIVYANLGQPERARPDLEEGLRRSRHLDIDPQLADLQAEAGRTIGTLPQAGNSV